MLCMCVLCCVDPSEGSSEHNCLHTLFLLSPQVAIKIIDKTQLNPNSLQKVRILPVWLRFTVHLLRWCDKIDHL